MKRSDYAPYLRTLRRIPAEVRQSMATREFLMGLPWSCVCGWAIADELLAATGKTTHHFSPARCVELFGGTHEEWDNIFCGVCDSEILPRIETAFTVALLETL